MYFLQNNVVNLMEYSDIELEVKGLCTCPTLEAYKTFNVFIRWNKHQNFK